MTEFEGLLQRAEKLEGEGELYAALECWRKASTMRADAGVWCRLARVALELEMFDEADDAFRSAIKLDGALGPAYVGLGTVRMKRNDAKSAEELFLQALVFEERPSIYCLLGSTQLDLGKVEEARQSFSKALALDPEYEEAHYNLGVIFRELNPKESESFFRKALELDGDFAAAHRELGFLLLQRGDAANAEVHLRRARQLDPESMWGRVYLANLLWQRGCLQEARQEYVAAILLAQDLGYPRFLFANFLEVQGELDEAEKFYQEALALDPNDAGTLARLGGVRYKQGDIASARAYIKQALEIEPKNKAILKVLGDIEASR